MGNVFTLDSLREEIEREYAPLVFEADGTQFTLRSVLRCGKKERDAVMDKLKALESEKAEDGLDEDKALDAIHFVLKTVTADNKGAALVRIIADDLLMAMKLLEKWTEATQPGEAQDSPS